GRPAGLPSPARPDLGAGPARRGRRARRPARQHGAPRVQRRPRRLRPRRRGARPHGRRRRRRGGAVRQAGRRPHRRHRVHRVQPRRLRAPPPHPHGARVRRDRGAGRALRAVRRVDGRQRRRADGAVPPGGRALRAGLPGPRVRPPHDADVHDRARRGRRDRRPLGAPRRRDLRRPRDARRRARSQRHGGAARRGDPDLPHDRLRPRDRPPHPVRRHRARGRRRAREDRVARRDARARVDGPLARAHRPGAAAAELHRHDPRRRAAVQRRGAGAAARAVRDHLRAGLQPHRRGRPHPGVEARHRVHARQPGAGRRHQQLHDRRGDAEQQGHRPLPAARGEVHGRAQLLRPDRRRARRRRPRRLRDDDRDRARRVLAHREAPRRRRRPLLREVGRHRLRLAVRPHGERHLPVARVLGDAHRDRDAVHRRDHGRGARARAGARRRPARGRRARRRRVDWME
ncbi:MAG: hypothetical protein AVDCRST_MAG40-1274, partial [uncultured Gemmatimonadaceae bacterium]